MIVSVAAMTVRLSWQSRAAVVSVNLVNALSRRLHRGSGTVAGGRLGLSISKNLLFELSRSRSVILVSGTNGKTTTSAMVRRGWGGDVAGNETGANMPEGHVAAMCASSVTRVVLETDEAWLPAVVASTTPTVVILLNLSRDQLDRANEVRQMAQRWRQCLSPELFAGTVVANASDPLVVYAAEASARVRWVDAPNDWRADATSCPHCTRALMFTPDSWSCACGFAKPTGLTARLGESLEMDGALFPLDLGIPGAFNEVNASLAVVALRELGVDVAVSMPRIRTVRNVQGRYGRRRYGERTMVLLLAKNPAGAAALLDSLGESDVWMAINARVADGKDPSWLYDVPVSSLRGRRIACLGERRLDLATRLTYGGVDCDVVDNVEVLRHGDTDVTLIANYTAFQDWMARTTPC